MFKLICLCVIVTPYATGLFLQSVRQYPILHSKPHNAQTNPQLFSEDVRHVHSHATMLLPYLSRSSSQMKDSLKRFRSSSSGAIRRPLRFLAILIILAGLPNVVQASIIGAPAKSTLAWSPSQSFLVWLTLFLLSATLHSAESAITKISNFKVQEFADEEGPSSPFATLSENLTRFLSTILITTTACSIYSTALFVATMTEVFPQVSLGMITALLTVVTLFFGELLPKALAVSNSELVARKMVPFLSRLAAVLRPVTSTMTFLSELVLKFAGMRSKEDNGVTEDMLRIVVDEAERSEGIKTAEGRMIKGVLDMEDIEVNRIMQPRVDIVALPVEATAPDILRTAIETRYSRIPVYRGDIDHIVGIVFSKDLLLYIQSAAAESAALESLTTRISSPSSPLPKIPTWSTLKAADIMERAYFIPETMTTGNALQEMRKRRGHMAIVVDEYGGTSGLVTFEDILEEVVGEIYDEDDDEEHSVDSQVIFKDSEGNFIVKGFAELGDVCEAMGLELDEELQGEYSTVGGLLCSQAGEIPSAGDKLVFGGFQFTVKEVEDNRRIVTLLATKLRKDFPDADKEYSGLVEEGGETNAAERNENPATASGFMDSFMSLTSHDEGNRNKSSSSSGDILTFRDGEWVAPTSS